MHDAWLRLGGDAQPARENRAQFFGAAAEAMDARLIELRFFAGLSNVEAAQVLGLSERTAKRTWACVRVWLRKRLSDGAS